MQITKSDPTLSSTDSDTSRNFYMGMHSDAIALKKELDSAIEKLKANGELDKLVQEHITDAKGEPTPSTIVGNKDGETYVVGVTGDLPPMDYVNVDGAYGGFNVALLNAIAQTSNCNFEIVQIDSAARLTALISKKIDILFWLGCVGTEGVDLINDDVLLSEPYYSSLQGVVTKNFPIEKIEEMMGMK